jgi:hypothetical protein
MYTTTRPLSVAALVLALTVALHVKASSASVQSFMTHGGISLRTEVLNIGPNRSPVIAHFYIVPPKGAKNSAGHPLTVDDFWSDDYPPSTLHIDLFVRTGKTLRRINSLRYTDAGLPKYVESRWLRPKDRFGPVLLIRFGAGDDGEWWVLAFPHGLKRPPHFTAKGFIGLEHMQESPRFDTLDRHGNMQILDERDDWPQGRDGRCHEKQWISHWTSHGFKTRLVRDRWTR